MKDPKISPVATMLDFSESGELNIKFENIESAVLPAIQSIEAGANAGGIEIESELTPDLPKLKIDRNKIESVIGVLLKNAVLTSRGGQSIRVRSFVSQIDHMISDKEFETIAHFRKGDRVLIVEIKDFGSGLPVDRIFDPFFPENSDGLSGLFACKSIINFHGGYLQVQNISPPGVRSRIMLRI